MFSSYWRLVAANRNFRLLWIAQLVSELGDWFYSLSVYHLLLELTGGKAQAVAFAVVLQVLPQTLAAPTAGVINDRTSRKRIMIGADIARFFIVMGMLLVRTPGVVWLAYPLLFLETVAATFFEPGRSGVIPNIVRQEEVLSANALASITWSSCLAVGAALGGLMAVRFGRDAVFLLNAFSFLASAWLIRRMRFAEPHTAGLPAFRAGDLVDFRPMMEGVRYIRSQPRLLATVFVKGGLGLLGANNVLLPIFGERIFPIHSQSLDPHRTAILGMSLLMAARGAGSLLGPLIGWGWAGQRQSRLRNGILFGFLLAAAGYVWLGLAASLAVALVAVALAHAGSSSNWVFSSTLLQIYSEDRFRGRVFAADNGVCTLGISLSSYLAGACLDLGLPARAAAIGIGGVMLLPAAAWARALKTTGGSELRQKS